MENAVEALKIAFAVMMFVVALTLSISSFSNAREAASSIIYMSDREEEYTYVTPSEDLTRTVGIETVVPTMYRAYKEQFEVYFFKENGDKTEPFILYNQKDDEGNDIGINYISLKLEKFETPKESIQHLDKLLDDGLYNRLAENKFKEELGEYYEGTGNSKIKKRVITYTLIP